jgi:endonuclease/exonuclease/phosphatase family metal-dependent hydrolase
VATFHAAVSAEDGRDAQIASVDALTENALLLGADLNADPSQVRRLVKGDLVDTLDWDDSPTWPVDADAFIHGWEEKLGEKPRDKPQPRRLDYLLARGLEASASGIVTLARDGHGASDHRLVWADLTRSRSPTRPARCGRPLTPGC